ncbi:MAG: hypothetical protein WCL71_16210 [Deltaproteobacteria bacterium]
MSKDLTNSPITVNTSKILIYQAPDGTIRIDVRLEDDTVWLSQDHMSQLFGKSKKPSRSIFGISSTRVNWTSRVVVRKFRTTTRFIWDGSDECDPASGFGGFVCDGDILTGRIYIHDGDDSSFEARKISENGSFS